MRIVGISDLVTDVYNADAFAKGDLMDIVIVDDEKE